MNKHTIIAPSFLAADFTLGKESIKLMEEGGADWVHLDVMDGSFVPDITFGHKMVGDINTKTDLPLDVHLMVEHPQSHIDNFIKAGADYITFHMEAEVHSHRTVELIKQGGVKAGISIVPSTPVSAIKELIPYLDLVLVMTVNPGFGGQIMIPRCLNKIEEIREISSRVNPSLLVSIDGGVNSDTINVIKTYAPDVIVTGSAFFKAKDKKSYINTLRSK
ncbi:ribulose-phosphate 3-epimerase [Spirochaeta cellobiosiphila]|uniref:ribulose-phosphate 3-epimerase n=1 Tax=Spirochaeta cellobiosiphila TaxID=504483 RepID=UPI00041C906D|nr:ribulose-phosphate 3-epimerase [Spirochaeta cellobiosiphila]